MWCAVVHSNTTTLVGLDAHRLRSSIRSVTRVKASNPSDPCVHSNEWAMVHGLRKNHIAHAPPLPFARNGISVDTDRGGRPRREEYDGFVIWLDLVLRHFSLHGFFKAQLLLDLFLLRHVFYFWSQVNDNSSFNARYRILEMKYYYRIFGSIEKRQVWNELEIYHITLGTMMPFDREEEIFHFVFSFFLRILTEINM